MTRETNTARKPTMAVHIRWMIRRDMPEVLAIEQKSFEHPWSEEDFLARLRQRNTIGMVAEYGEIVAGFMVYDLYKKRIELTRLAVERNHRGFGVGRQLAARMRTKLHPERRTRLELLVRESNLDGQMFLRAVGFRAENVVRRYWEDDTGEDAYRMIVRLEGGEE